MYDAYIKSILAFLLRGLIYLELSTKTGIPYLAHPLREPALSSYGLTSAKADDWIRVASSFVSSTREKYADNMNNIAGVELFEIQVPFVLPAIIHGIDNPSQIIPKAVELRNSKEAFGFRQWCTEVNNAIESGDGTRVSKALRDLETLRSYLETKLGLSEAKKITSSVGSSIWILSIGHSLEHNLPGWLTIPPIGLRNKHLRFLHNSAMRSLSVLSVQKELEKVLG